jgi:hypothetical protein
MHSVSLPANVMGDVNHVNWHSLCSLSYGCSALRRAYGEKLSSVWLNELCSLLLLSSCRERFLLAPEAVLVAEIKITIFNTKRQLCTSQLQIKLGNKRGWQRKLRNNGQWLLRLPSFYYTLQLQFVQQPFFTRKMYHRVLEVMTFFLSLEEFSSQLPLMITSWASPRSACSVG